jgi:hypothetical protein
MKTSKAYAHYRSVRVSDPDGSGKTVEKWQCRHCDLQPDKEPTRYKTTCSTTTLLDHVKSEHANDPPPPRGSRPLSSSSPSSSSSSSSSSSHSAVSLLPSKRARVYQQSLHSAFLPSSNAAVLPLFAKLFARCSIAHHIVDSPEFINALEAFRTSTVSLPNRRQLRQAQSDLAQQLRAEVVRRLKNYCRSCPLTVAIDGWTNVRKDKVTNVVILCGGVAFYWCSIVNSRYHNTAKWLKTPLMEALNSIIAEGLRFTAIATDNEEVNKTLHALLLDPFKFLLRSPCSAHLIQLCVLKAVALPDIAPIMSAVELLLRLFKLKANRLKLKELQLTAVGKHRCLIAPNDTRWSSWLMASHRLLELKSYVEMVQPQQGNFWTNLGEVVRFLQPFQLATDVMQSDSSTVYDMYQQFKALLKHVDSIPNSSCFWPAKDAISTLMTNDVLTEHADLDLVAACALLSFDPNVSTIFPATRLKSAEKWFVEWAAQYALYWQLSSASTLEEARAQSFAEWTTWNARVIGSTFEEMDDEVNKLRAYHIVNNRQTSPHGRYHSSWNPRAAWANHITGAPILCNGAIALLSVAGSEAAVERSFSAQGTVHSKRRNRLLSEAIEAEVFIRFNSVALSRKPSQRDQDQWVELTEDWEETVELPSAVGLFEPRVVADSESDSEEEEEEQQDEKEEDVVAAGPERKEEKDDRRAPPSAPAVRHIQPTVRRIPPPAPSGDDVQRFIASYLATTPYKIHARTRWLPHMQTHLSEAGQAFIPPMRDTDSILVKKVMAYVKAQPPALHSDAESDDDVAMEGAEPEL